MKGFMFFLFIHFFIIINVQILYITVSVISSFISLIHFAFNYVFNFQEFNRKILFEAPAGIFNPTELEPIRTALKRSRLEATTYLVWNL